MTREMLYKFFEGTTSYEEEVEIRQWMEHSPENARELLKERKIFDSILLLDERHTQQNNTKKQNHISYLRTMSKSIKSSIFTSQ